MPKKRKILSCPCCENEDIIYKEESAVRAWIQCSKCLLKIEGKYLKSIINKWNKRPKEKYDKIFVEGNNSGDFIKIEHIKNNLIRLEIGHCCVYVFNHEIPVEILAALLSQISFFINDEKELLRKIGWNADSEYTYKLLKQVKKFKFLTYIYCFICFCIYNLYFCYIIIIRFFFINFFNFYYIFSSLC